MLDRTLEQYGPETKELRELLRRAFAARIERLFPQDRSQRSTLGAAEGTTAVEGFQQRVRALAPQNDAQRSLQAHALEIAEAVVQARWLAIEQEENTIPTPFLVVLVFWLAAMFTSFGLFAPRNAIAIAVLFLGALSLSASVFLIEDSIFLIRVEQSARRVHHHLKCSDVQGARPSRTIDFRACGSVQRVGFRQVQHQTTSLLTDEGVKNGSENNVCNSYPIRCGT